MEVISPFPAVGMVGVDNTRVPNAVNTFVYIDK